MKLGINDKPKLAQWVILAMQHVFAMFGATVLVPILTGLPISVALFASGLGTIIYALFTKGRSPVYLGSSFAYIAPIMTGLAYGGGAPNYAAVMFGLFATGMIYVLVAQAIRIFGTNWIHKLLPPVVVGPTIMVIGLGLAGVAVGMLGTGLGLIIGLSTALMVGLFSTYLKGFAKMIPIVLAIVGGYIFAALTGMVDFAAVSTASWLQLPDFVFFKQLDWLTYKDMVAVALIFIPVSLVTITEHIGDHLALGSIIGKDLTTDPGLSRTLMGDGVATAVSGLLGGPANTTYGENTGVIAITKVASKYVIWLAAAIAIGLSFFGKFTALISTVPVFVMGGISLVLFGIIASSGVRVMIQNKVDFNKQRNLIISSVILVAGVGGLAIGFLSAMSSAVILGVILNLILKK